MGGLADRLCCCLPILFVLILGGGLAYYFLRNEDGSIDLPSWPPNLPNSTGDIHIPNLGDFLNDHSFNASTPQDSPKWTSVNNGVLQLEVLNALDSEWHSFFDQAISDWDNGSPDVLSLSTQVVEPDTDCSPVDGVLKVCNGDYGATDWRGINVALVTPDNIITTSTAKMNEYYLQNESDDWKQYTMCHEIGHGFGLPHTDENPYNRDLGNCLDYTNNPTVNLHPDTMNYEFLAAMYDPNWSGSSTSSAITSPVASQSSVSGGQSREQPSWIFDQWASIVSKFEKYPQRGDDSGGWRLLMSSHHGQINRLDIGEGYSMLACLVFDSE